MTVLLDVNRSQADRATPIGKEDIIRAGENRKRPMRKSARDVLNKLKWHEDYDFAKLEITYVHRGAPGDIMVIRGSDIVEIGKSFFTRYVDGFETSIPYHRIQRIEYEGEVLFSRKQVRERRS